MPRVGRPKEMPVPLDQAAAMLGILPDVLRMRLEAPGSFFRGAAKVGGEWRIPLPIVRRWMAGGLDLLFTLAEAAEILGFRDVATLRKARQQGKLEVVEVLGEWRIRASELSRLARPKRGLLFFGGKEGEE